MASSSKRLTLTTASPFYFVSRLPGRMRFPDISAKLVRICEITGNFHRCKIFFGFFLKFCKREVGDDSNELPLPAPSSRQRALQNAGDLAFSLPGL